MLPLSLMHAPLLAPSNSLQPTHALAQRAIDVTLRPKNKMKVLAIYASAIASIVSTASASGIQGYYSWNWGVGSSPPGGTDGVAFTGLTDVAKAISGYPRKGKHGW